VDAFASEDAGLSEPPPIRPVRFITHKREGSSGRTGEYGELSVTLSVVKPTSLKNKAVVHSSNDDARVGEPSMPFRGVSASMASGKKPKSQEGGTSDSIHTDSARHLKPGPPHLPMDRRVILTDKSRRTWAERGGGEVSSVLESGAVTLLSARWLVEYEGNGNILVPRQALPPEAFLALQEIQAATGLNSRDRGLPIISVSHIWASVSHPDPKGFHLRKLCRTLRVLLAEGGPEDQLAIFIDFCCIHQACRDSSGAPQPTNYVWDRDRKEYPEGALGRFSSEEQLYTAALSSMATLFSHPKTRVFMLSKLAPQYEEPSQGFVPSVNQAPFIDRGWCFCELECAMMVKNSKSIVDLGRDTGDGEMGMFALMIKCAVKKRTVALIPADFEAQLESKSFAKASDRERVAMLYRTGFVERFASSSYLWYDCQNWGDAEAIGVAKILGAGAVPRLEVLNLCGNSIGGAGATALAEALESAPLLRELDLERNQVGDKGAAALANGLLSAPLLKELRLNNNGIGDAGVEAIATVLPMVSSLKYLYLKQNKFGDVGAAALANALPHADVLRELHLGKNDLGEAAIEQLTRACAASGKALKLK